MLPPSCSALGKGLPCRFRFCMARFAASIVMKDSSEELQAEPERLLDGPNSASAKASASASVTSNVFCSGSKSGDGCLDFGSRALRNSVGFASTSSMMSSIPSSNDSLMSSRSSSSSPTPISNTFSAGFFQKLFQPRTPFFNPNSLSKSSPSGSLPYDCSGLLVSSICTLSSMYLVVAKVGSWPSPTGSPPKAPSSAAASRPRGSATTFSFASM